jgi:hypothetical protein
VNDLGYNPEKLYFLKNILNYISVGPLQGSYRVVQNPSQGYPSILAYLLALISLIGLGFYVYHILKKKIQKINKSNKNLQILYVIILTVLGVAGIISFFSTSYMITELIFLVTFYGGYLFLREAEVKNLKIDFLFISWFAAFFIFHGVIPLKVDRYFITMAPPLAYGVALGINQISGLIKYKIKGINATSALISILLVFSIIFSTVSYIDSIPSSDPQVKSEQAAAQWLMNYDPQYKNKTIAADRGPAFGWYLKKYVYTRIHLKVTPEVFKELINEIDPDYYIYVQSGTPLNLEGYHVLKNVDGVLIYEKN